jgi:hypothetical protein
MSGQPSAGGATLAQTVKSAHVVDSTPYQMSGDPTSIGFTSPSGNITCMIFTADQDGQEVQCDITDHTFTLSAHDCHGAGVWGRRVQMLSGQAPRFICAGDYLGQWPALDYGNALSHGSLSCVSEKDGVTCLDGVTGNGFRLARASYVLQPGDSSDSTADPDSPIADFAGVWDQHGGEIVFNSSGAGDFRYRTYVNCDSAPAPCDRIVDNEIVAGGHVTLTLTSATPESGGTAATGSVTASNDPRIHQGASVEAKISDGRLQIRRSPTSRSAGRTTRRANAAPDRVGSVGSSPLVEVEPPPGPYLAAEDADCGQNHGCRPATRGPILPNGPLMP